MRTLVTAGLETSRPSGTDRNIDKVSTWYVCSQIPVRVPHRESVYPEDVAFLCCLATVRMQRSIDQSSLPLGMSLDHHTSNDAYAEKSKTIRERILAI